MKQLSNLSDLLFALVFTLSIGATNPPLFFHERERTEEEEVVGTIEVLSPIFQLLKANGLTKFYLSDREIWAVDLTAAVRKYKRVTNDPTAKHVKDQNGVNYLLHNVRC